MTCFHPFSPGRWAWAPLPGLAVAIIALWVADLRTSIESQALLWITNFAFSGVVALCIAWLAGRAFLSSRQPGLVMLGCGSLCWGLGTMIAVSLLDRAGNATITVHNLAMLGAAACHLAGVTGHAGMPHPPAARRQAPRLSRLVSRTPALAALIARPSPLAILIGAYAAMVAGLGLLTGVVLAGWTPVFFVEGRGGTPLRQIVLLAAMGMFGVTSALMLRGHRHRASVFLSWYGLGLALLAVGLAGVLLQPVHGCVLSWVGRIAQLLGGAYLFVAAVVALRATGGLGLSWAELEQAWQRGDLLATVGKEPVLHTLLRYGGAVAVVAIAFALQEGLGAWSDGKLPVFLLFYPAVMMVALFGGWGPGLLATGLTLVTIDSWHMLQDTPPERLALVLFAGNGCLVTLITEFYRRNREKVAIALRDAELTRSQRILAELIEQSPFGVYVVDSAFRIAIMNQRSQQGAFRNVTPVIGRDFAEAMRILWPDDIARAIIGHFRHTLETGDPYYSPPFFHARADLDTAEAYEWELHRISLPDGQVGVVCYFYDSTKLRESEAALRESEALLRAVLDGSPDPIFLKDRHSRLLLANPATFAAAGKPATDCLGKSDDEYLLDPADGRAVMANDRRIMATGQIETVEETVHTPTGPRYYRCTKAPYRDAAGNVIGLIGVGRDITERQQAEEALRRSEARYRLLHESLRDPFVQVDMEGRFLDCNDLYCQMVGYTVEELRQLTYQALTPERWHEPEARIVREQIIPRGFSELYEKEYRRKDGTTFPIELRSILWRDEQGQPAAMWGIVRDITGRKAAEQALRQARDEMETLVAERTAQLRQTTALAEAERHRFFDVLETLPVYVCLLTPEYRIRFANRVFREWFGSFQPDLRGHEILFHRSEPCPQGEAQGVLHTHQPQRREWTGPNGRQYEVFNFPFRDSDGSPLILEMGVDITEARQAQARVKAERQRLYDVLESLPAMICLLSPDHRVVFANRAFRDRFGEANGRHCYEQCFGNSQPCHFCETYEVLKTGKPHHWEVRLADGTVLAAYDSPFTDVDGTPLILEMDLDISAHRQMEAALKELNETLEQRIAERTDALRVSEERLRLLGDNLPDSAVYQYVLEPGGSSRFLYFSAGIERLTGVTVAEVLSDPGSLFRQVPPEYREQIAEAQARSQRELSDFDLELPMCRENGTVRWMQLHSRPRRLPDGSTLWEGVQTDITGRRRAEDAIKAALAEKEVLLREIHHRVKNNMQVLSSLVSLQSQSLAKDQRESQAAILESEPGNHGPTALQVPCSTLRLRNAFDDLRDRVRSMALVHENLYQTGNFAAVDFVTYARNLLTNLWHAHRNGTAIGLQFSLEPVAVPLDQAVPCGLLLNELAINALKHAFRHRQTGTIIVSSRTLENGRVSLRVTDDGVGLPEDLNWQEAPSLGLRLVRLLAQQLRGTVEVRRPQAGGTEFEITFEAHR